MEIKVLDKADKKRILEEMEPYGVEKLNYLLIKAGHRIRIFSGNISKKELIWLFHNVRIDNLGLYLASLKDGFRLNLDSVHILKHDIKGKLLEVNDEDSEKWFRGENLEAENVKDFKAGEFLLIKNSGDFIGSGKFTGSKILNFLPKERLIR